MNLAQLDDKLSIVSQNAPGYRYIHVIEDVRIAGTTLVSETFTDSTSYYTFEADGYFIITELKLPTTPGAYYYIDDEIVLNPAGEQISVEELMEVDTAGTSIVKTSEDYITMYLLEDYYILLLKGKYLANICNCGCGCIDKQDKVKLDTLTMGLDLVELLISKLQYYEVQRIVEKLQVCFGMISNDCDCH